MQSEFEVRHNQLTSFARLYQRGNDGCVEASGAIRRLFVAGSIAKIYLVSAAFAISHQGDFNLDQKRRIALGEFKEGSYGSGEIRLTNFPLALALRLFGASSDFPVMVRPVSNRRLLQLMLSKSDNLATLVVANSLGREQIQQVLTAWGMKETTIYNPQANTKNETTANDLAVFLGKLSSGLILPTEEYGALKKWLPQRRVRRPELLPLTLCYKEGQMLEKRKSFYHRLGLIERELGEDFFVILTEGITDKNGHIPYFQKRIVKELEQEIIKTTH